MTQMENRNSKDWTNTVMKDLDELNINLNFNVINMMKKPTWDNMIDKAINGRALNDLNTVKAKHSKVLHLKHDYLNMKQYLKPNQVKSSKEEIQLIFKLRCRVTETKKNYQGMYDEFLCDECGEEEESQQHILECRIVLDMNKEYKEMTKYEKLFYGTVSEQVLIARLFKQNMDIKENL